MNSKFFLVSYNGKGGIKEMLAIAFPMIVSYACDVVMHITDRFFLSRVALEAMNAVLGGSLSVLVLSFFFVGLLSFSTTLVAQYFGSKQNGLTSKVFMQTVLVIIVAYPLILLLRPLAIYFFSFMDLPQKQLLFQIQYFNILIIGVIFTLLRTAFIGFFSGIGETKVVMVSTFVTMLLNVALNYVFIFGKLGIAPMGVQGAALGTVIAGGVGLLVYVIKYFSRTNMIAFDVRTSFSFDRKIMKQLFYFGSAQGTEMFVNMLAFNVLIFIFQSQGNVIATATTITFNWDYIAFIPLIGIEVAIMSLVGRYMGSKDVDTALRSTYSGLLVGLSYSFVCLFVFVFFPDFLVKIFKGNDPVLFKQVLPIAKRMIQLASLYVLFDAIMVCLIGALRGAGDTYWTMWASMIMHWVMVGLTYLLFEVFAYDVILVWIAVIVVIILFALVLVYRFYQGKWKNIEVIK